MNHHPLRIGTRRSPLAMWQANHVASSLRDRGVDVEIIQVVTEGDRTTGSLRAAGGRGLFTKAIQLQLLEGRVDLAVHSLKDLATEPVDGLMLAAVPSRAPAADVLVCRTADSWKDLPRGAVIGTGSPRRAAQLKHLRPDVQTVDIRGNVDTRLRKLESEGLDAIVLAEAGLQRLGFGQRITERLPLEQCLPAAGQGALGIETRVDDDVAIAAAKLLDDPPTHAAVVAERAVLRQLRAGCLAPVGAYAHVVRREIRDESADCVTRERLHLHAAVLSEDGRHRVSALGDAGLAEAKFLGEAVAQTLIDEGADALIAHARRSD